MIFTDTTLRDAVLLEPEPLADERGFFARLWCERECAERGLNPRIAQCSVSVNRRAGTLRGLHYQAAPYQEAKLIRCVRGAIHDVIVDLRPDSPTFLRHFAVGLSQANRKMLYAPEGFAHGFQTLADDTEVWYQMSEFHMPSHARGLRWDDPLLGIEWPPAERIMTDRDRSYPDFSP